MADLGTSPGLGIPVPSAGVALRAQRARRVLLADPRAPIGHFAGRWQRPSGACVPFLCHLVGNCQVFCLMGSAVESVRTGHR